jgi:hypothetical protein
VQLNAVVRFLLEHLFIVEGISGLQLIMALVAANPGQNGPILQARPDHGGCTTKDLFLVDWTNKLAKEAKNLSI